MSLIDKWRATLKMVAENEMFDTTEVRPLVEEIERLRALIAETKRDKSMRPVCHWCRSPQDSIDSTHAADCPAFTVAGEVK